MLVTAQARVLLVNLGITLVVMIGACGCTLGGVEPFEDDISVSGLHKVHHVHVLCYSCLRVGLYHADVVDATRSNLSDTPVHQRFDQSWCHLRCLEAVVRGQSGRLGRLRRLC